MSIFDNCSKKLYSKETELFVLVKYGEPDYKDEFFDRLPGITIHNAYKKTHQTIRKEPLDMERTVLSIMLRQPANKDKARRALIDSLVEYHLLLG